MTADGRRTDDGTRVLRIGTRGSTLATTQTGTVRDALERAGHRAELHIVHTPGDASQAAQTPVTRIGVGVFTETLRTALAAGECDVAVHSFKDLPTAP
ncbi:hydroxymethylbilane synthase, partial [Corynebacterium bovis]